MFQHTIFYYPVSETAVCPTKAHTGSYEDAAYDIYPDCEGSILPGERVTVTTGLRMAIPDGYWLKLHERSGNAASFGLHVLAGVVDSGYTGEVKVVLYNSGITTMVYSRNKAIAQATLEKVRSIDFEKVDSAIFATLEESRQRKQAGFSSSDTSGLVVG